MSPIGKSRSPQRRRADRVLKHLIEPAVRKIQLEPVRVDVAQKPGRIDEAIIRHVAYARAAVADLTEANPNVYYELGLRHTMRLPVVLIAQAEEELPFDIKPYRVLLVNAATRAGLVSVQETLAQHLADCLRDHDEGSVDAIAAVFHELRDRVAEAKYGLRPPGPNPVLLKRAGAAHLAGELEHLFRSATETLEPINESHTFLATSAVTTLLVCLDEADGELLALWRNDEPTNFFDQDVPDKDAADYLAHLSSRAPIHQTRILVYPTQRRKPPTDGATLAVFHDMHAPNSLLAASSIQLPAHLRPLKFGCTISQKHKCAVIPVSEPQSVLHRRLGTESIGQILASQPPYDPTKGPMSSIVTFHEGYVDVLTREFLSLARSGSTYNCKPCEESDSA
jgi:hypothetical protein